MDKSTRRQSRRPKSRSRSRESARKNRNSRRSSRSRSRSPSSSSEHSYRRHRRSRSRSRSRSPRGSDNIDHDNPDLAAPLYNDFIKILRNNANCNYTITIGQLRTEYQNYYKKALPVKMMALRKALLYAPNMFIVDIFGAYSFGGGTNVTLVEEWRNNAPNLPPVMKHCDPILREEFQRHHDNPSQVLPYVKELAKILRTHGGSKYTLSYRQLSSRYRDTNNGRSLPGSLMALRGAIKQSTNLFCTNAYGQVILIESAPTSVLTSSSSSSSTKKKSHAEINKEILDAFVEILRSSFGKYDDHGISLKQLLIEYGQSLHGISVTNIELFIRKDPRFMVHVNTNTRPRIAALMIALAPLSLPPTTSTTSSVNGIANAISSISSSSVSSNGDSDEKKSRYEPSAKMMTSDKNNSSNNDDGNNKQVDYHEVANRFFTIMHEERKNKLELRVLSGAYRSRTKHDIGGSSSALLEHLRRYESHRFKVDVCETTTLDGKYVYRTWIELVEDVDCERRIRCDSHSYSRSRSQSMTRAKSADGRQMVSSIGQTPDVRIEPLISTQPLVTSIQGPVVTPPIMLTDTSNTPVLLSKSLTSVAPPRPIVNYNEIIERFATLLIPHQSTNLRELMNRYHRETGESINEHFEALKYNLIVAASKSCDRKWSVDIETKLDDEGNPHLQTFITWLGSSLPRTSDPILKNVVIQQLQSLPAPLPAKSQLPLITSIITPINTTILTEPPSNIIQASIGGNKLPPVPSISNVTSPTSIMTIRDNDVKDGSSQSSPSPKRSGRLMVSKRMRSDDMTGDYDDDDDDFSGKEEKKQDTTKSQSSLASSVLLASPSHNDNKISNIDDKDQYRDGNNMTTIMNILRDHHTLQNSSGDINNEPMNLQELCDRYARHHDGKRLQSGKTLLEVARWFMTMTDQFTILDTYRPGGNINGGRAITIALRKKKEAIQIPSEVLAQNYSKYHNNSVGRSSADIELFDFFVQFIRNYHHHEVSVTTLAKNYKILHNGARTPGATTLGELVAKLSDAKDIFRVRRETDVVPSKWHFDSNVHFVSLVNNHTNDVKVDNNNKDELVMMKNNNKKARLSPTSSDDILFKISQSLVSSTPVQSTTTTVEPSSSSPPIIAQNNDDKYIIPRATSPISVKESIKPTVPSLAETFFAQLTIKPMITPSSSVNQTGTPNHFVHVDRQTQIMKSQVNTNIISHSSGNNIEPNTDDDDLGINDEDDTDYWGASSPLN